MDLDAIKARADAASADARALLSAVDSFDGRIAAMPSTWARMAEVVTADVPALVAEVERLREALTETQRVRDRAIGKRSRARAEVERLTAQIESNSLIYEHGMDLLQGQRDSARAALAAEHARALRAEEAEAATKAALVVSIRSDVEARAALAESRADASTATRGTPTPTGATASTRQGETDEIRQRGARLPVVHGTRHVRYRVHHPPRNGSA